MKKKGISGFIVALLLIALALVVSIIVWTVVNNIVQEKLKEAESCFKNFNKVTINSRYTCYNSSGLVQFSIDIGDIDVEGVLIAISAEGRSKSFTLTTEEKQIENLTDLSGNPDVKLPEKNGGQTYIYNWGSIFLTNPDSIKIAPIIDGIQCEVSDSLFNIDNCNTLSF